MIKNGNSNKDNILDAQDILADERIRVPLSGIISYDSGKREFTYKSNLSDTHFVDIWRKIRTRWEDDIWVSILVNCFSKNKSVWHDDYLLNVSPEMRKVLEHKKD